MTIRPETSCWPGCSVGIFAHWIIPLAGISSSQLVPSLEMRILFDRDKSSFSDGWFGRGGSLDSETEAVVARR